MGYKLQNEWRPSIIFGLMLAMLLSLFLSRAMLSISMACFVLYSFTHTAVKTHIRNYFHHPMLWSMSLLFAVPLLTGLWSEDHEKWLDILRIKAPLMLLPLAFAGPFGLDRRKWILLAIIFVVLMTLLSIWTFVGYLADMERVHLSYLKAKTMTTPLENDHVRFSWLLAVAALLSMILTWLRRQQKDASFWVWVGITAWLFIFLHLLAARTGLLSLYMILFFLAARFLYAQRSKRKGALVLIFLLVLPAAAYFLLPTFRNRVDYIRYDLREFAGRGYLPGGNDAVRFASIKAGWTLMNRHPLTGTGFGDIEEGMQEVYEGLYPGMLPADRILPSSEWMMYGAGAGWPGFLLFTTIMLTPFFMRTAHPFFWALLNGIAAFGLVFDIGLEVQFGVFIYAFVILLVWKWLLSEKI